MVADTLSRPSDQLPPPPKMQPAISPPSAPLQGSKGLAKKTSKTCPQQAPAAVSAVLRRKQQPPPPLPALPTVSAQEERGVVARRVTSSLSQPTLPPVLSSTPPSSSAPAPLSSSDPALPSSAIPPPSVRATNEFDPEEVSRSQQSCPELQQLLLRTDMKFKEINFAGHPVMCEMSTGIPRPVLPPSFRLTIFQMLHNLAHPGIRALRQMLTQRFLWAGMNKDINTWAKECLSCQRGKVSRHTKPSIQQLPVPLRRFSSVHIDIVGPLSPSGGYTQLLTIMDRTTRWPEICLLADTSAKACALGLVSTWISRFGVLATLTSDRGTQFTSLLWEEVSKILGIKMSRVIPSPTD